MFAFLIWDDDRQTLVGARDFFGIKPMYYSTENGHLLVGSELKSFLEFPGFHKELNREAVKPYLMNQYNDFPEMQYHMDEPDANPSIIPLWYLCKLARKHVTVALSGEGADELFAGYVNYGMHTHHSAIKRLTAKLQRLSPSKQLKLARVIKKLPALHDSHIV